MSKTKTTIKKPVVKLDVSHMTAEEKVVFARATQNTAKGSTMFQGSPAAQTSMASWQKATDALDANNQSISKEEKVLATLRGQEAPLVYTWEMAASDYAANVRLLAINDPTVVPALGLTPAAPKSPPPTIVAPLGVHIATTKAGADSFAWDAVPGARLYMAQISSVNPPTDASWSVIEGGGRKRKLAPLGLVHGQVYLLRVRALGAVEEGPWSATLTYTAK